MPAGTPTICYQKQLFGCLIVVCPTPDAPCPCEWFIEYTTNTRMNVVSAGAGEPGNDDYRIERNVPCAFANICEYLCTAGSCDNLGLPVQWTCPSYELIGDACIGVEG